MTARRISVIIPTRNRAALLDRTLQSILGQTLPRESFEVIVVDNGSTDATPEVCRAWAARLPNFRSLSELEPGLHVGRHAGMRAARSELLVYADDDIRAFPSWLDGMLKAFDAMDVGIVGGNNLPEFEAPPPVWWEELKEKSPRGWAIPPLSLLDYGANDGDIEPHLVWGCNFGVRRSLVEDAGGFHPDGMPADRLQFRGDGESYVTAFAARRGLRIRFAPRASIHHFTPASRLTEKYLHARGYAQGFSRVYAEVRRRGQFDRGVRFKLFLILAKQRYASLRLGPRHPRIHLLSGYQKGIATQVRNLERQPELRSWITRENYLSEC